jgi:hypothetical protein
VDPHRSSYPEESEPRWYGGEQQYAEPEWERREPRFEQRYADEGFRHPDPRGGGPAVAAPPGPGMGAGPIGPRSGEPLPPLPPREPPAAHGMQAQEGARFHGEPAERNGLRRSAAAEGVYRARRPAAAVGIWTAAALLAIPLLRVLLHSGFGSEVSAAGTISSGFALLGLPLSALGLYALVTGAARVPDVPATRAWLRPPLAYLVIGLVLFIAAGLAAG